MLKPEHVITKIFWLTSLNFQIVVTPPYHRSVPVGNIKDKDTYPSIVWSVVWFWAWLVYFDVRPFQVCYGSGYDEQRI